MTMGGNKPSNRKGAQDEDEPDAVIFRSRSEKKLYNNRPKNNMSEIVEESEDELEDDFEAVTNANLTINLPKQIRDTFMMRKTEIEMANGYVDLPHL